jgi:hypothetical protein
MRFAGIALVVLGLSSAAQADPIVDALRRHWQADPQLTESADYATFVEGRPYLDDLLRDRIAALRRGETPSLSLEEQRWIVGSADDPNPLEFDLLLAGLSEADEDVRNRAKIFLLKFRFRTLVQGAADRLIPLLSDYAASEQSCALLGLLALPEPLRAALLSQARTPWEARARLGDANAEAQMLAHFAETNACGWRHLAPQLFYADTRGSWRAFASAMGSTRTCVDFQGQESSEAFRMIITYRDYFEAKSFQPDRSLLYIRGEEFAKKAHDYLRRIEREIERDHGVSVAVKADFLVRNEVPPHILDVVPE